MSSDPTSEKPPVEVVKRLSQLPPLKLKASPRDGDLWLQRLEEEYTCLIKFVELNKANDSDWFEIESNEEGTRWTGTCWHIHNHVRYQFDVEFDIPATYPTTPPEIELPQLDGKTAKMYRGGKICLTDHFYPLWAKNVPKFGIAHILALGLAPWLNAEIPYLVQEGTLSPPVAPAPSRSLETQKEHELRHLEGENRSVLEANFSSSSHASSSGHYPQSRSIRDERSSSSSYGRGYRDEEDTRAKREEKDERHDLRPRRELQSYRETNPSSRYLIMTGVPISVTEESISDSLKAFGPLETVDRVLERYGNVPREEVKVEYESEEQAFLVLTQIRSLRPPFSINGITPHFEFFHEASPRENRPTEDQERPLETSDSHGNFTSNPEPKHRLQTSSHTSQEENQEEEKCILWIDGFPRDYQSRYELESLFTHLLGLGPSSTPLIISDIQFLPSLYNQDFSVAKISFTAPVHVEEVLKRSGGRIVLRGFPLTMFPPKHLHQQLQDLESSRMGLTGETHDLEPPVSALQSSSPETHSTRSEPRDMVSLHDLDKDVLEGADPEKQSKAPAVFKAFALSSSSSASRRDHSQPSSLSSIPPTTSNLKSPGVQPASSGVYSVGGRGRHFVSHPSLSSPPITSMPPFDENQDLAFCRALVCLICRQSFDNKAKLLEHTKTSTTHLDHLESLIPRIYGMAKEDGTHLRRYGAEVADQKESFTSSSISSSISKKRPRENTKEPTGDEHGTEDVDGGGIRTGSAAVEEGEGDLLANKRRMLLPTPEESRDEIMRHGVTLEYGSKEGDQEEKKDEDDGEEEKNPSSASSTSTPQFYPGVGMRMMQQMGYDGGELGKQR